MGYIPWYERIEQEKAEREGKKINSKEVDLNKKNRENEQRRSEYLKRQWGISEKPPRKVIVQRTETKSEKKSPELTGVDRYILAKKI